MSNLPNRLEGKAQTGKLTNPNGECQGKKVRVELE